MAASPQTMLAVPLTATGGPEKLTIKHWPKPTIQANEVLVEVRAFGLNFADILARKGYYNDAPKLPFVLGYEAAGTIAEIGPDAARDFPSLYIGQKVIAWTRFGGYAQFVVADPRGITPLLEGMSYAQGASIPVVFATAYHCLWQTGPPPGPSSRVLIHAAAGGLGQAAIQLCRLAGCQMIIGTCGSPQKAELIRSQGVHLAINYSKQDFEAEVKKFTENQGVDIVIDSLGGSYIKKGLRILRPGGRVVGCGGATFTERGIGKTLSLISNAMSMSTLSGIDMAMNCTGYYGVNMLKFSDHRKDLLSEELKQLMQWFAEGKLKAEVSREYPWDQTAQAHRDMETRKTTGKVVLIIPEKGEGAAPAAAASASAMLEDNDVTELADE